MAATYNKSTLIVLGFEGLLGKDYSHTLDYFFIITHMLLLGGENGLAFRYGSESCGNSYVQCSIWEILLYVKKLAILEN